jgi:hypothetical protein
VDPCAISFAAGILSYALSANAIEQKEWKFEEGGLGFFRLRFLRFSFCLKKLTSMQFEQKEAKGRRGILSDRPFLRTAVARSRLSRGRFCQNLLHGLVSGE